MAMQIWLNIISCNCSLPDGTKPLSEPMLTLHERYFHSPEINFTSAHDINLWHSWECCPKMRLPGYIGWKSDKTLYGLRATQRHKEIRGIFNGGV